MSPGGLRPGDQLGVPVRAVGDIAVLHNALVRIDFNTQVVVGVGAGTVD